jgi:spore germination protein PE
MKNQFKMKPRRSYVGVVRVVSVGLSSIVKVGDTGELKPSAKIFAVQRQVPVFQTAEGDLSHFPTFSREIPLPVPNTRWVMHTQNEAEIEVGQINIIGVSASSIVHIGSVENVKAESRTKHIRQFVTQ